VDGAGGVDPGWPWHWWAVAGRTRFVLDEAVAPVPYWSRGPYLGGLVALTMEERVLAGLAASCRTLLSLSTMAGWQEPRGWGSEPAVAGARTLIGPAHVLAVSGSHLAGLARTVEVEHQYVAGLARVADPAAWEAAGVGRPVPPALGTPAPPASG
jgi:hypothetical protein